MAKRRVLAGMAVGAAAIFLTPSPASASGASVNVSTGDQLVFAPVDVISNDCNVNVGTDASNCDDD